MLQLNVVDFLRGIFMKKIIVAIVFFLVLSSCMNNTSLIIGRHSIEKSSLNEASQTTSLLSSTDVVLPTETIKKFLDYNFERDGYKQSLWDGEYTYIKNGVDVLLDSNTYTFVYPKIEYIENAIYSIKFSKLMGDNAISFGFLIDENSDSKAHANAGVIFNLDKEYNVIIDAAFAYDVVNEYGKDDVIDQQINEIRIIKKDKLYSIFINNVLLGKGSVVEGEMGKDIQIMINNNGDSQALIRIEDFSVEIFDE